MKAKKQFVFTNPNAEYVVRLSRFPWWWLLLLLLPLVLLIHLPAKVNITVTENNTHKPIEQAKVTFSYFQHYTLSFKPLNFFVQTTKVLESTTNSLGKTFFFFTYPLYQRIFYRKQPATINVYANCFSPKDTINKIFKFIKAWNVNILVNGRTQKYVFTVVDSHTGKPIPNALIKYQNSINDNKKTDLNGQITLELSECFDNNVVFTVEKYGYESLQYNKKIENINLQENRRLPLVEKLGAINFYVKDLDTKKPIPNAEATIFIEESQQNEITSVDGQGIGHYDSLGVSKNFYIKFTHPAYYDTVTQKFEVSQFIKLSEQQRTFYMRPKPGSITFYNIDADTKDPLEGVLNEVYVNGFFKGNYYSNSFGEFSVPNIHKTDRITIHSSKNGYNPNNTKINNTLAQNINTKDEATIPLNKDWTPQNIQPPSPNCGVHFSGTLLNDFYVEGHISVIFKVDKYGEYVGQGEYPLAKVAFPNAHRTTFDAIAVDKGTRLIIYSKPNFQGDIILDITGPALINNVIWKDDNLMSNFTYKTLAQPYESLFPHSCRQWSKSNMHSWSEGSIKIICNQ